MAKNSTVPPSLATDGEHCVSHGFLFPAIIAIVVFTSYSVVLTSTFGAIDDYVFLLNAIVENGHTSALLIGAGRPLNAFLLELGFRLAGSVENLAALRGITLAGIWLLGCALYYFSRLHSVSLLQSLTIACGVILLPSFQVYASWAQHFTTPYAGILALASAFILTPVWPLGAQSRILTGLLSTLLLTLSMIVYQPIAMLFCTGLLISFAARSPTGSQWTRARLFDAAVVFGAAMAIGYLAFRLGQNSFPSGSSRYGLVENLFEKSRWFFSEPLANAFSLFSIPRNNLVISFVAFVVAVGALATVVRLGAKVASLMVVAGVIGLIGSYIPNLATAENWASYRSIGALGGSVFVLFVFFSVHAFEYVKSTIEIHWPRSNFNPFRYSWLTVLPILFVLSFQAQRNVLNGFILPNVIEIDNLASSLKTAQLKTSGSVAIRILPSSWTDSAAIPIAYDEFGIPSSRNEIYARTLVEIVLRSMNLIPNAVIASSGKLVITPPTTQDTLVTVNFPDLVTSQRFKTALAISRKSTVGAIVPLDINDDNWQRGIWVNSRRPNTYSFVYKHVIGDKELKPGDKVAFTRSGTRNVVRVDRAGTYFNVLVDGEPISPDEGFPNIIKR